MPPVRRRKARRPGLRLGLEFAFSGKFLQIKCRLFGGRKRGGRASGSAWNLPSQANSYKLNAAYSAAESEENMALGLLMILFIVMSVISVVGISLLYLMKSPVARQVIFYIMAVWGMFIAVVSATGLPTNYTLERLITWAIGFLSVAGIVLHIRSSEDKARMAARLLVTISVAGGIIKLFLL